MRLHGNKRQKRQQLQQHYNHNNSSSNEKEIEAEAVNRQQRKRCNDSRANKSKSAVQETQKQRVGQQRVAHEINGHVQLVVLPQGSAHIKIETSKLTETTPEQRQASATAALSKASFTTTNAYHEPPHTRSYTRTSAPLLLPGIPRLLLLVLLCCTMPPHAQADWLMDCGDCMCKWQSGKKTADCKNLTLNAVPENLSNEVQVLDLSFNRVAMLEQNAFLNADLHNLHKLFMRNASLQQIDPRTFTQLEILIELDLSNNLLRTLQANVFVRLVKVRAIVLNGNLLEALADGVFQNLKYLHKIELKHNRLVRIGQQAFGNVPLLSQIYLDANRLNFLRKDSFESLKRLTALSLDSNPWNCTCELQIFRDFVLKRNLYTPPTACYYPVHLRGMLWIEDQPEAFACKPRIIYPARGASINTSKENVTLVCRVHASPNTLIAWDFNRQQYRASTGGADSGAGSGANTVTTSSASAVGCCGSGQAQRVHIQLLRDEQSREKEFGRDVFISRLTIVGAEKSDEGVYTCTAENAGGKDAVQMSLLVQRPGQRDLLLQGNLIIVISLMALGLLSVSAFLALITCCIYKRFKTMSPSHHRHHHHHHLDVADQLTPGMDGHQTTTTTVTGGTDVVLGMENAVGSYKHHLQKKNANGDVLEGKAGAGGGGSGKYTEVIKHGITVMDNGGLLGSVSGGGGGAIDGSAMHRGGQHAEKMYLERSSEDTLHIKYPHGPSAVEINRLLNTASTTMPDMSPAGKGGLGSGGGRKWRADVQNGEGQLGGSGRAGEYQPDLLPAYSTHKVASNGNSNINGHANSVTNNQLGQLYSPIKATRTINLHDDQQMSQQKQQLQQQQSLQQQPIVAKSKYNINAQEYLQSRYGAASKPSEKTLRRGEVIAVATTSIALTSTGSIPTTTVSISGVAPQAESGFSTLQRHSKSVALPPRTPTDPYSATVTATVTGPSNSNIYGYEYRQPPPPPYNSAHRTASGLQLLQRRTSISNEQNTEQTSATKDLGYREAMGGSNYGAGGGVMGDGARQTIVTASSSLQFLTTRGYGGSVAPQRQLL